MNEIRFDETPEPLNYATPPQPLRPREAMDFVLDLLGGPLPILLVLAIYLFMFGARLANWLGGAMIIGAAVLLQGIIIYWSLKRE